MPASKRGRRQKSPRKPAPSRRRRSPPKSAPSRRRSSPPKTAPARRRAPPPASAGGLRLVAQVDADGAEFFHLANHLAADPRVKFIFGRAAEEYENAAKTVGAVAKGKGKAKVPAIFPFDEYETIECYVCGHVAEADDLPEVCPGCGAARYAFEREVSQDRAWDLVLRTTKDVIGFARKAGTGVADPKAKDALAKAAEIRKGLLAEAKEERARTGGATP